MSNPVFITCKKNVWKKVSSGVTSALIFKADNKPGLYIFTSRLSGKSAPISQAQGVPIFINTNFYYFESVNNSDIYIMSVGDSGEVNIFEHPSIGNLLSNSKRGIISTTFADDYIAQGKAFQVQRRITLTSAQTIYLVLDTTALIASGKRLIILPLIMSTNGGSVFVDTYPITSYTGGSEIKFARVNSTIENYAESVFKTGVTPTGTPNDELRQYIVGSLSTNQFSGGGAIQPDLPKRFPAGSIITAKLVNQETSNVYLDFGLVVYEV